MIEPSQTKYIVNQKQRVSLIDIRFYSLLISFDILFKRKLYILTLALCSFNQSEKASVGITDESEFQFDLFELLVDFSQYAINTAGILRLTPVVVTIPIFYKQTPQYLILARQNLLKILIPTVKNTSVMVYLRIFILLIPLIWSRSLSLEWINRLFLF